MNRDAAIIAELRHLDPSHPDYLRVQLLLAWHDRDQLTERFILRRLLDELEFGPLPTVR